MSKTDVIRYGNIEAFRDAGSLLEFYGRLGLTPRFGRDDICHVDQLRISISDHRRLREMIQAEVHRREPPIIGRIQGNTARTDWFHMAPLPSDRVPDGELWVVPQEFSPRTQEAIKGMSKLDIPSPKSNE